MSDRPWFVKRLVVLGLWLALFFFSLFQHHPWRDEYQSYLVSTRTETFTDFIDGVRHERHPPLHYLMQRGLDSIAHDWPAKVAVDTVTVPFTIGSVILLLFFLDLELFEAAALIFGIYVFREYGIISRCYSLGLFFLLLAVFFRKRSSPAMMLTALVLSAGTHLLFTLVSGTMFLSETWEQKAWRKPRTWFAGLGFGAWLIFQAPPKDSLFNRPLDLSFAAVIKIVHYTNQALWPLENWLKPFVWNSLGASTDLMTVLLLPLTFFWLRSRIALWRALFFMSGPILLLSLAADSSSRHIGVAFSAALAAFLLYGHEPSVNSRFHRWPHPLRAFATVGLISSAVWWLKWQPFRQPPRFDFSASYQLGEGLPELQAADAVLLSADPTGFFSWMAESGKSVFDIARNHELRYPYFIKLVTDDELKPQIWSEWCSNHFAEFRAAHPGPIYFGTKRGQPAPEGCGRVEKIFETTRADLTDETIAIYRPAD